MRNAICNKFVILFALVALCHAEGTLQYPNIKLESEDNDTNTSHYLLITNNDLASAFQPLVDRRISQGFSGDLITIETIDSAYTGIDIQEKIRNCIKDYYDPNVSLFVALGGDAIEGDIENSIVPVRYCDPRANGKPLPADSYYADVDGGNWDLDVDGIYGEVGDVTFIELTPEVYLGRIPVRTSEEANGYVEKVIHYEDASPQDFANSLLIFGGSKRLLSGSSRPSGFTDHDPVEEREVALAHYYFDWIQPYWQAVPFDMYCDTSTPWDVSRYGDYSLSVNGLTEHLNSGSYGRGYHFVLYSGHANYKCYTMGQGRRFNVNHAGTLTNVIPSIIISGGCGPAGFDQAEPCLSEAFLRNPHGGAAAFFGYARSVSDGSHRDQLFLSIFEHRMKTLGEAITHCKATLASTYVGKPYHHYSFHLQGDPCIQFLGEESDRHLQLFQPKGYEIIENDSDLYIRWNAAGTGFGPYEFVKLDYSPDGGQTWYPIPDAEALPYNGSFYIWEDCWLPSGSEYRVRVTSLTDPTVSDMSRNDFTIGDLGLLTVGSAHASDIQIEGLYGNVTNYNISVLKGEIVNLRAPDVNGLEFVRWSDGSRNTLSEEQEYEFEFTDDMTVVAEYGFPTGIFYVNDETPDDDFSAGDDENDGLTPQKPMRHIQALLDKYPALAWGDVIEVSAGTYHENITLDATNMGLELRGAGQDVTIIDGNQNGSCFYLDGFKTGFISGLTIMNGTSNRAGGIYCVNSSTIIHECTISDNISKACGGGMHIRGNSHAKLIECIFEENHASEDIGGAVYVTGSSCLEIQNCTFKSNSSGSGWYDWGGAIQCASKAKATIDQCTFEGNEGRGGGAICNASKSTCLIRSCLFEGNTVLVQGGAIYNVDTSESVIENCIFSGNSAANRGGAIANIQEAKSTISNCTFNGNYVSKDGGGLLVWNNPGTILTNCIFWGNISKSGSEISVRSHLSISYSDIEGGRQGMYEYSDTSVYWGEGNIDVNPLFVRLGYWADANDVSVVLSPSDPNAVWVNGDYHLKSQSGRWDPVSGSWAIDDITSPCIDAGDPNSPVGDEPEPNGGRINIGAYGGTPQASMSLSTISYIDD